MSSMVRRLKDARPLSMKKFLLYILSIIITFSLYSCRKQHKFNDTITLNRNDKIPYGTFVLYKELPTLFSGVKATELRIPLYDHVNNNGRAHGKERDVDEPHADPAGCNA